MPGRPAVEPAEASPEPPPTHKRRQVLFEHFSGDLESAVVALVPRLGLSPLPDETSRLPERPTETSRLVCAPHAGGFTVVYLHRGTAPAETLLHVLHDMSWLRQNVAGTRDVEGLILSESKDHDLATLLGEVPNVSLRTYRLSIELTNGSAA